MLSLAVDAILCLERVHEALWNEQRKLQSQSSKYVPASKRADLERLNPQHWVRRQGDEVLDHADVQWTERQLSNLRHVYHGKVHVLLLACVMLATKVRHTRGGGAGRMRWLCPSSWPRVVSSALLRIRLLPDVG